MKIDVDVIIGVIFKYDFCLVWSVYSEKGLKFWEKWKDGYVD